MNDSKIQNKIFEENKKRQKKEHNATFFEVKLEPPPPRVELLFGELEELLGGELGEVEVEELPLEHLVQAVELAVPARTQVSACYVDIEDLPWWWGRFINIVNIRKIVIVDIKDLMRWWLMGSIILI